MINADRRRPWQVALLAAFALLGTVLFAAVAAPARAATASTTISVNGSSAGRTFDGIGAISGGGGNSRLLIDYPAAQQSQILDYLFKPDYGANLQILKVEIGGDANSTSGAEPSIEHSAGNVQCDTGYEFWLMEQAKARNPNIKLYGLAWAAPGWIGDGNFWSTDMINYLISWLGCAKADGLAINYLGGWNERGYNVSWYEQLRNALNNAGYGSTEIVGADSDWSVANDVASNSAFANAVQIIGTHYPCQGGDGGNADTCPANSTAESTGKPLWASENGSQDMTTGAPALIRSITRGYTDAEMTAYINWPLIAALTPNLPYPTDGMMTASQPWSGNYSIGESTWATAQVTQFTQPGWQFLNSGSGYLGGNEQNGTYVSLKSTNNSDYSTVIETTTATAAQTVNVNVSGGLSTGTAHVWATDVNSPSPSTSLIHTQDITPSNGSYSLTAQPGYIYTLTTTTGQGEGTATSPAAAALTLPYSDNYDADATGSEPKYLETMQGAYQVEPCANGRAGQCVQQLTPTKPIEWQGDSDAFALVGDVGWSNYTVSSDVDLQQAGTVELYGRANTQARPQSNQAAYLLRASNTGAWSIDRSDTSGTITTLTSGTTTALGTGSWHTLALTMQGSTISGSIDGKSVGSATDTTYTSGQAGIGVVGYQTDQFDNLAITPGTGGIGSYTAGPITSGMAGMCLDDNADSSANGNPVDIYNCNNTAAQVWQYANGTLQINGSCLDVVGNTSTADGTLVDLWTCNGGANQQWNVVNGTLVNPQSGKCLDDPKLSTTPGTQLDIWDCNGGANQKWTMPPIVGPITVAANGMCLDDANNSTADGNKIEIWGCNSGSNQQWELTAAGTLLDNGKCLDVTGGATADGTLVDLYTCNGTGAQTWQPQSNGDLLNPQSGKCLDDPASSNTAGTQVEIWDCNDGANQQWALPSVQQNPAPDRVFGPYRSSVGGQSVHRDGQSGQRLPRRVRALRHGAVEPGHHLPNPRSPEAGAHTARTGPMGSSTGPVRPGRARIGAQISPLLRKVPRDVHQHRLIPAVGMVALLSGLACLASAAPASAAAAASAAPASASAASSAATAPAATPATASIQPAANTSVCNIYCDARDPALAAGDRLGATATVWSRNITLHFDDADDMAWANIANGSPTDEVWLDRSFDGGATWASGSKLGDTTIPAGDTGWRTLMYNVDNPSAHGVGAVRACGKAGDRTDIACTPWLRTTTHAGTASAASITALMQYFNPANGSWSGGPGWQDANAVTDLIDYMQLTGDSTYAYAIPLVYQDNGGANFTDSYIDDTGWWGLAWLRAYQYTGNSSYLQTAEYDANYMDAYWDTGTCGGGVWWSTAKTSKTAIANELFLELNAALHNTLSGDTTYLSRAQQEWTWISGTGMINAQNLVNDGIDLSTCKNNGATAFTYNQGVILAGLSQLNLASPNAALITTANAIATAATTHLVSNGILVDPCEPNGCANDGYSFKGVFVRDLAEFARTTKTTAYNAFLGAQASSISAHDTDGDGQSGLQWAGPLDNLNYPDQQSASDAFNATLNLPTSTGTTSGAISGYDGLCVDVAVANTADGTKVDIYTCNNTGAQQWTAETDQTLQALGKCLDVAGGASADGTLVQLYTCNNTGAQTWQHQTDGAWLNPQSGKCLDDPNFSTTAGTQLEIWDCNGGANQQWAPPST